MSRDQAFTKLLTLIDQQKELCPEDIIPDEKRVNLIQEENIISLQVETSTIDAKASEENEVAKKSENSSDESDDSSSESKPETENGGKTLGWSRFND